MDDQLRTAYERLDGALEPPGDAVALVARRVARRRRERWTRASVAGAVAAVVTITGIAVGLRDDQATPAPGAPAAPGPSPSQPVPAQTPTLTPLPGEPPSPGATMEGLECLADIRLGSVQHPENYSAGSGDGPTTLRPWLLPGASFAFSRVDEDQLVAELTTNQGDRYANLGLVSIGQAWRVESLAACTSAFPGLGAAQVFGSGLPLVELVAVGVGHCWVETLDHDGRSWDLRDEEQFGWGGLGPDDFLGVGSVKVAGDRMEYVDLSGARLTFVPADTPGTDANEGGCA